jgi:FtsP/CotA-like multicopper oxidase with cupredoxin domain
MSLAVLISIWAVPAMSQSFRVQCPTSTITHPDPGNTGVNNAEPAYNGPTQFNSAALGLPLGTTGDFLTPKSGVNGAIKCQQVSGGDGYSTMGDGNQIFMFSFGPLSGLADIAAGRPGTQFPYLFNTPYSTVSPDVPLVRGDPATTDGAISGAVPFPPSNSPTANPLFTWNGAVGLAPDVASVVSVSNLVEGPVTAALYPGATVPGCPTTTASATTVTAWTDAPLGIPVGGQVVISLAAAEGGITAPPGYASALNSPWTVTCVASGSGVTPDGFYQYAFQYTDTNKGLAADTGNDLAATASSPAMLDGHVDPRPIMDVGVMNGSIPAPLVAIDEDDELFLTLTNVGMIMRPDLFEQHTIHFHGYPNASSFYDGVPDASVAINIGASFTYYYEAPDAGTYFYHCHITPPEHLQMGMVGQLYVRPRQNRVPPNQDLYTYLGYQNGISEPATNPAKDLRTECDPTNDILCSASMPAVNRSASRPVAQSLCNGGSSATTAEYVYNDGDGSTCYDVTYPIQMHGFDPNFHFVGMTFNPEMFVDMKDKYFLLNGRSYPDTVAPGPQATATSDGQMHYSQPLPAVINIPAGGKASLRLVNLSVAEYFTLQSQGVPMHVVGWNAKLLRDQDGNSTEYYTNSITLGGGESNDVILDASDDSCSAYLGKGCAAKLYPANSTFYVYSRNLDMLSNDAENFGGMMTEVHICSSVTGTTTSTSSSSAADAAATFGNTCSTN